MMPTKLPDQLIPNYDVRISTHPFRWRGEKTDLGEHLDGEERERGSYG
jgi:hypothetical protein